MRRLVPDGRTVPLTDVYGDLDPPPSGWTAVGMVTTVDGAVAVDGVSAGIGGEADLGAFRALRSLADVVVVGAGTAAAEDYSPVVRVHHAAARRRRGQAPVPRLALVTGSGELDPSARVLADPSAPPLVLTTARGARTLAERGVPGPGAGPPSAEVVVLGEGRHVEAVVARAALRARGLRRVVLEGGPTLNAAWIGAGVVDELFVTIAPQLVGRDGPGIAGLLPDGPVGLVLQELRVHGGELVLRYLVDPGGYRGVPD